jgi:predicted Zn-dependent protease
VNRTLALLLCLIAAVAGWVVYSKISPLPTSASAPLAPKIEGSKIYFVPIGDFPTEQLQPLVQYYRQKYNLEITVVNSVPVDPTTRDASRQQLMAENLAASIRNSVPEHASETAAILIGFTSEDMYPTSKNWQFAFGWREGVARTAVVSTARLSLPNIGQALTRDLPGTRLRKIVTKDIGILYYGLPQSQNPNSVLYNQIMGIDELDEVGEDF